MPRPLVAVLGSGTEEHAELSIPLGLWLGQNGYDLLTGGGCGVMAAVCKAFASVSNRRGMSIGILPAGPTPRYPNPWLDFVIQTHLPKRGVDGADMLSRNHINVLSAAVAVALPGQAGTRTEVLLALQYNRPLIAFLGQNGAIDGLERTSLPTIAVALDQVAEFVQKHVPKAGDTAAGQRAE